MRFFSGNYTEEDRSYVEEIFGDDGKKEAPKAFLLSEWNKLDDNAVNQVRNLDYILGRLKLNHKIKDEINHI